MGNSIRVEYLGGHPKVQPGKIHVASGSNKYALLIDGYEIEVTRMEWDEKGKRSAGKAAAGAIIGGALTGGIGLLAGAALGGRKKDMSVAILTYFDGPIENAVYLRCSHKEYQQITALMHQ